jgi:sigma-B regulation protein RsbU (phosphoserine phosphatase)
VLYTDGILDAASPTGDRFGEERFRAVLGEAPAEPEALVGAVTAAVSRFTGNAPQADDVTCLAVAPDPSAAA